MYESKNTYICVCVCMCVYVCLWAVSDVMSCMHLDDTT